MAQCVVGGEKRPIVGDKEVIDVDVQPNKRLKQVRLPFKPLDCKPPTPSPVANNSASKKRKSSGPDSPTAKPKLSKLPDLRSSAEKIRPAKSKNDNEVSSSSEAESLPASGSKSRSTSNNILEKFVRRENEISSTNDVIDLTGTVVLEENEENSPVKVMSPKKPRAKLPSETNTKEEQTPAAEANPVEKGSCSEQTASSAESNTNEKPGDHFVRKLVFDSEKTGDDCKSTAPEDKDTSQNLSLKEDNEESMQEDVPVEAEAEGHQDEGDTSQNDETPDESIVIKTDSDDESSQSQKEEEEESSSKTPVSKKKPRSTSTPQTRGSANTSCSSIEGATPTSENKAKRPLSKKQAERAAMREKVKQEKERQKQEAKEQKEKERLENKKQRDEEKAEKEKAKMEEKEKKEKERQEKKEQLEKEKQDKLKQKEEERKKKQEMLDAKEEERKQKEEEKRLKEEQKLKEEEEKQKLAEKRKAAFTSFFTKPTVVTSTKVDKAAEKNLFIPFEVKKDMTLAPVTREVLSDNDRLCLDEALSKVEARYVFKETGVTYLTQLKQGAKKLVRTNRVLRNKVEAEEDVELLVHDSEAVKKSTHAVKLLQFHTDYRPPYYGTWHKKMAGLSPRNPWKKYEDVFDYEVNSDEEWEEEEPGESLSDSNGEEEEGDAEEDEVDEDDWMVPHGYLSADEGCDDDEEVTPEVLKARQRAKAQAWETELTAKRRVAPPVHIGCHWLDSPCSNVKHLDILKQFEMMFLRTSPVETLVSNPEMLESSDKNDSFASKNTPGSKCFRKRALPEEAMPDLIRLLHGNSLGIKKMVREFRLYWRRKSSDPSTSLNESKLEDEPETQEKSLMETSTLAETGVAENLGEKSPGACTVPGDDAGKTNQEGSPGKTQNDSVLNEDANDCCVSKRQLEMKIMAIAAREKREGTKRPCWYVKSDVLQQYNMADLPMENSWVYISIDMTKKTPNKPAGESKTPNKSAAEKKTPNKSANNKKTPNKSASEKKTPRKQGAQKSSQDPDEKTGTDSDALVTPHKGKGGAESNGTPKTEKNKKEASAKKKPKDQPSIMAFAKKTPSKPTPVKKDQTKEVREASNFTGEVIDVDMEESAQAKSSPANVPSEEQKKEASAIEKPSSKMDEDCIVLD